MSSCCKVHLIGETGLSSIKEGPSFCCLYCRSRSYSPFLPQSVGYWDLQLTKSFVHDRFWRPRSVRDVYDFVKSCDECQRMRPLRQYCTTLHRPLTSLFEVFSIDLAGPFPTTRECLKYLLVCVEHLTGWPIARATKDGTAETVMGVIQDEFMHLFGPPETVVRDNAS